VSPARKWIRSVVVALPMLAGSVGIASAAPNWTVDLNSSSVTWNAPFSRDTSSSVSSSNSTSTYSGHGAGSPGAISAFCRVETNWLSGFSGGGGARTAGAARADDFVISGPPGSISATLHLRIVASFGLAGGFPGNGGHGAHVWANLNANGIGTFGDYYFNNFNSSGTGLFSGYSGPVIEVPVNLSGTFPVNSPFVIQLYIESTAGTYGNYASDPNPGFVMSVESVLLDSPSGQVMTLPDGYTVNSPSWNVVNNTWSPTVGIEPSTMAGTLDLRIVGPNPAAGDVSLACRLPAAGAAQIAIFDLSGRRIRTLINDWCEAGERSFVWDGRTDAGVRSPDGVFFARVMAGGRSVTRRIVRVR